MPKYKSHLTAAVLTAACVAAAPAQALSVTYVSGKGTDKGDCSSTANPCRTFQFAHDQTLPAGEVKALDAADYGPVTVNKSISITGVEVSPDLHLAIVHISGFDVEETKAKIKVLRELRGMIAACTRWSSAGPNAKSRTARRASVHSPAP